MKSKLFFTTNNEIVHSAYYMQNKELNETPISQNVGRAAFKNDSTIEYVSLNSKVEKLSESSFENCNELKIVENLDDNDLHKEEMEESNKEPTTDNKTETGTEQVPVTDNSPNKPQSDKPLVVQYHAFKDCYNLHTVFFSNLKTKKKIIIEKEAFLGCKSLRTVAILDGNADIADDAFKGCDNEKLIFVITSNNDCNCSVARFARENGFQCIYAASFRTGENNNDK